LICPSLGGHKNRNLEKRLAKVKQKLKQILFLQPDNPGSASEYLAFVLPGRVF